MSAQAMGAPVPYLLLAHEVTRGQPAALSRWTRYRLRAAAVPRVPRRTHPVARACGLGRGASPPLIVQRRGASFGWGRGPMAAPPVA